MKLSDLPSTTQARSTRHGESLRHFNDDELLRVEAMQGIAGDRQRSLQQEMSNIEAEAVSEFHGEESILHQAQQLACEIVAQGRHIDQIMKSPLTLAGFHAVDLKA